MPAPEAPTDAIEADDVSLAFFDRKEPALQNLRFRIRRGERVLILGPSGSGKTSLALAFSGIIPKSVPAKLGGTLYLAGAPVDGRGVADNAGTIAYVFQSPESQFCTLTVEDEIAFALENRCLPPSGISARIDRALALVGLPKTVRGRELSTLSGGEKQKVGLAAALAQDVQIYVFDEVTSQLDAFSTEAAYATIEQLSRRSDATVILIDHKLDRLVSRIDRVLLLDRSGRLVADASPASLFHDHHALVARTGAWRPHAADLVRHLRGSGLPVLGRPLDLRSALDALDQFLAVRPGERARARELVHSWSAARRPATTGRRGGAIVEATGVSYRPRRGPDLVRDVSITLFGGEVLGLLGPNGAGKTTLGWLLAGLIEPTAGTLAAAGVGPGLHGDCAFQNPEHQFVAPTVEEELLASFLPTWRDRRRTGKNSVAACMGEVHAILDRAGLLGHARDHPFALSEGEKRKLSVLAVTVRPHGPVLVLDEPSYGLDQEGVSKMEEAISALRDPDRAIVLITHDLDCALRLCDRVAVMIAGRIVRVGETEAMLGDASFLAAHHLARPAPLILSEWLDGVPA